MTTHNDFNDDNDDFTTPGEGSNAADSSGAVNSADDSSSAEASNPAGASDTTDGSDAKDASDAPDISGEAVDFTGGKADSGSAGAEDRRGDDSEAEADLPQLLRQVSRALRREFRSAAADSGFDPRDFGRLRRGRRRWDAEDVAPDGGPYNDDPGSFGPPWARGNWGPSKNIDSEEMRQRLRDLRDSVGDRVEDVLTSEEFEHLKASLSKLADAFGAQRCEDDGDRGPDDHHSDHDHSDHDHGDDHGHDDDRDQRGRRDRVGRDRDHRGSDHRRDGDHRRGGGRGRRGFGPNFGPRIGPGLGAGRRGFDPFGWVDERLSKEQEIQDAFERGFAAGFEQGRNS